MGLPLSLRWYRHLQSLQCLSRESLTFPLHFFFFWCVQDISGDDDAIDTGAGMTEVDEGVVEGQEIA